MAKSGLFKAGLDSNTTLLKSGEATYNFYTRKLSELYQDAVKKGIITDAEAKAIQVLD